MFKRPLGIMTLVVCLVLLENTAFSENLKIGFVNMRKLFFDYKKTKDFNRELEREDMEAKKEIEKRTEEIRRLRDEIDLLSDEAKEKKKPQLEKALKDLDDYRKEKAESFIRRKDEMFQEIRDDIIDIASEYARKNNYNMILDGSVFVYSSEKYDITDDILNELNKE